MIYPHTSNWDFPIGVLFRHGADLQAQWMGKASLFRWPLGGLMRRLGGMAIDRRTPQGVTAEIIDTFRQRARLWLAITPEGTRAHVDYLKSGFYRIAVGAGVPCGLGFIDYATRSVGVDTYLTFSGDEAQDLEAIRTYYAQKRGKRPALAGRIAFR
jgi:1-acyl-sn-glycerol-3-phosphate acyltransferase